MDKKKTTKLDLQSKLLIAAAIVIAILVSYMCVEKVIDNKNIAAYEARSIELQKTIAQLRIELSNVDDLELTLSHEKWSVQDELNSLYYTDEDIIDVMAKILFMKATDKIIDAHTSDFSYYFLSEDEFITAVDGIRYRKTDVLYADVVDKYSKIFTGDLLDEILSERFIEIDGYLYISVDTDACEEITEMVEVERLSEADGEINYRVKYGSELINDDVLEYKYCSMTVKEVDDSYRVSYIDFGKTE